MVARIPLPRSFVMMSLALRSIFSDSSLTVTPSVMVMSFIISGRRGGAGGDPAGRATAAGRCVAGPGEPGVAGRTWPAGPLTGRPGVVTGRGTGRNAPGAAGRTGDGTTPGLS